MIPIYKPYLNKYKTSAINAIESEWISNHGIYVDLATETLKGILGVKYCILMNNGTSTTHCLFKALKFKHPEVKKIYVPNNVFIAPWNCALLEYEPEQLEVMKINPKTFNIDVNEIRKLDPGSAVLIVHNLGNIINVPNLKRERPDLIFIEDNCEGLFGKYEGTYTGTANASLCSAVSFYGNKTITTGEGGAFFTNDLDTYKFMKTYFSHGMSDKRYVHNILGTNYRMTNIQAAFLYDQLNDIETILSMKKKIISNYRKLFEELEPRVFYLQSESNTEQSNWMFVIFIKDIVYEKLEAYMLDKNVQIRPLFYDIHEHEHLKTIKKIVPEDSVEDIRRIGVMLPSYPELTSDEQKYIANCIKEYIICNC
jgi:perosamine synthetase